jgi:ABC-type sugar transport system ATPase subunit
MSASFIQFRNITKTFGGVRALTDVSLDIGKGECHGLMGENGAGKSTLGKVLAGIHKPNDGTLTIDGQEFVFDNPGDALEAGVAMVHQELAFCPDLSVAENLCMGRYPTKFGCIIDRQKMEEQAKTLLSGIGVEMDVWQKMADLSTAQEQVVQIAAAVGTNPRIIVFDEPTSSLSEPEVQQLFLLIDDLKRRGITTVYVSHRMPELFRLCDKISVLRDGHYVGTLAGEALTEGALVRMMVGRDVETYYPDHLNNPPGDVVLKVKDLSSPGLFQNINFEVRAGEIVGFAGLVGAGRSEIAKAIFGLDSRASGTMEIDGKPLKPGCVQTSLDAGVCLVPEDRKRQGCVLGMACSENMTMAMLPRMKKKGMLDRSKESDVASIYFAQLAVKAASHEAPVQSLSGGNQQKVVIAKWLARGGRLFIVDEPTRGVDVGAKAAIHSLVDELAREGYAVILISSELPELINLSSRVLVMREGNLVGELSREETNQESVLRLMAGAA